MNTKILNFTLVYMLIVTTLFLSHFSIHFSHNNPGRLVKPLLSIGYSVLVKGNTIHRKWPVTPSGLQAIHHQLHWNSPKDVVIWAAYLTAFFTLMRKSSLLPPPPPLLISTPSNICAVGTFKSIPMQSVFPWNIPKPVNSGKPALISLSRPFRETVPCVLWQLWSACFPCAPVCPQRHPCSATRHQMDLWCWPNPWWNSDWELI